MWKVPFTNLRLQYQAIQADIQNAVKKTFNELSLLGGEDVVRFEEQFAALTGTRFCVSTANGTDSLFAILKSLGLRAGDEVITPAFSWISSSETITLAGAKPVFADVDPLRYTIDPREIERNITPATRAVIVVHLYGQAAEMDKIVDLCRQNNLFLIEDCAQAHLTKFNGQIAGSFGIAGAFSFYPTKNLGAYGDAGCVVTSDSALAEAVRRFCNHGALNKYDHYIEGTNSRMDTLQAAFLLAKLPHLTDWIRQRQLNASRYRVHLKDSSQITLPSDFDNSNHAYHLFVIKCQERTELQQYLAKHGIQTLIHYPQALINVPAYSHLQLRPERFPVSLDLEASALSLPLYPELQEDDIAYVCEKIKAFYRKSSE